MPSGNLAVGLAGFASVTVQTGFHRTKSSSVGTANTHDSARDNCHGGAALIAFVLAWLTSQRDRAEARRERERGALQSTC